jgi:sulfoxide reductase heme-binding subunit YedZ
MAAAASVRWRIGWGAAAHVVVWLPLALGVWALATDRLGANPAQALERGTGDWALRFLWASLATTPLRQWLGQPAIAPWRRTFGLAAFGYAVLHALSYAWLDMGFEVADIGQDLLKRPFIAVGASAWLILAVLGLTSLKAVARALGGARWRRLHRLVYLGSALACLHFYWMRDAKNDATQVAWMAAIWASLMTWRLWVILKNRR